MHTKFWTEWSGDKKSWLLSGIGDHGMADRRIPRIYIEKMGYQSVLDIACGPCVDYLGFIADEYPIDYTGIDIAGDLLELAPDGANVVQGDIEDMPFKDREFDVSYARHIIEHLPEGYEDLTNEAIRVAKHCFILVTFRPFLEGNEDIKQHDKEKDLIHWNYSKEKFEDFVKSNPRVEGIEYPEDTVSGLINPETGKPAYSGHIIIIKLK